MNRKFSSHRCPQASPSARLAVLALALLVSGAATGLGQRLHGPVTATAEQGGAAVLLERAIVRLERQPSVAANLRQRIDLYERQLVGSGSYRQVNTGRDLLFRTELKVPVGDTITSLLQVCDGRFLWTYRALPHEQAQRGLQTTLTRVDLNEVRKHTAGSGVRLMQGIGYGGLPGLLNQTLQLFEFGEVERGVLHDVPVWLLEGNWRATISDRLLGDDEEGKPRKRPAHIPETVTLALGTEDLFPYRIEYRKQRDSSQTASPAESMVVAGGQSHSIMTLELFEVQTGQTIDPQVFSFQPTGVQIRDATDAYIRNQLASQPHAR